VQSLPSLIHSSDNWVFLDRLQDFEQIELRPEPFEFVDVFASKPGFSRVHLIRKGAHQIFELVKIVDLKNFWTFLDLTWWQE
jgi:hypothetical protein